MFTFHKSALDIVIPKLLPPFVWVPLFTNVALKVNGHPVRASWWE